MREDTSIQAKEKTLEICVTLTYIIARRALMMALCDEDQHVIQFCQKHLKRTPETCEASILAEQMIIELKRLTGDAKRDQQRVAVIAGLLPRVQKASEARGWKFRPTVDEIDASIPDLQILTR